MIHQCMYADLARFSSGGENREISAKMALRSIKANQIKPKFWGEATALVVFLWLTEKGYNNKPTQIRYALPDAKDDSYIAGLDHCFITFVASTRVDSEPDDTGTTAETRLKTKTATAKVRLYTSEGPAGPRTMTKTETITTRSLTMSATG